MQIRPCNPETDVFQARRIWNQIGWTRSPDDSSRDLFMLAARGMVAEVDNQIECFVTTIPGSLRYLDTDLALTAVTDVATSYTDRKQGLASRLSALQLASDAEAGAVVAGLRMFEQGFYDHQGFGAGPYEHFIRFDPVQLKLDQRPRRPVELSLTDWEAAHHNRLLRLRPHGSAVLTPPELTQANMLHDSYAFGLGYRQAEGETLSHHMWIAIQDARHGPYRVRWMAYRTYAQFLELLALLRNLGDQIHLVEMVEPPGIQMQDLLREPIKRERISHGSGHEYSITARAYWQVRILKLDACIQAAMLPHADLDFILQLSDPIGRYLEDGSPWDLSGTYQLHLGPESTIAEVTDETLPVLQASVGAFSRLWLGVRPATTLAVTDDLNAPPELLVQLDAAFRLPEPKFDWDI
ncbi:MAG: GNAT family N-acetyltransferase [Anaerolineales bacterium]|nr:GNAT family N-acetyltransferase [Anaerolineales bacterium]